MPSDQLRGRKEGQRAEGRRQKTEDSMPAEASAKAGRIEDPASLCKLRRTGGVTGEGNEL